MNELIEKLQDENNAKALGRHDLESRKIFELVGPRNCLRFDGIKWIPACSFRMDLEYIIKPDY